LRFRQGVPLYNTHIRCEPQTQDFNMLNRLGVAHECDGQTERRTDGKNRRQQ